MRASSGLHRIEADEAPLVRLLDPAPSCRKPKAAAARLRELGVACEGLVGHVLRRIAS